MEVGGQEDYSKKKMKIVVMSLDFYKKVIGLTFDVSSFLETDRTCTDIRVADFTRCE